MNNDNYKECKQFSQLIEVVSNDVNTIVLDNNQERWSLLTQYQALLKCKLLLTDMSAMAYTAKFLDEEQAIIRPQPYHEQLSALQIKVDEHLQTLKQDPQFEAMVFLEKAEKYIYSPERQWNVGFQRTRYTLDHTNTAIPKHVAKQLAEIKAAKRDGKFKEHREAFIKIGQQQANSLFGKLFSSKSSKHYSSLFAEFRNSVESIRKLDQVFSQEKKPKL